MTTLWGEYIFPPPLGPTHAACECPINACSHGGGFWIESPMHLWNKFSV